jgi:RNase H-fold protein (predicted Holliday junction resolvase)
MVCLPFRFMTFDYLFVDWGSKRTGVAYGDSQTFLVVPYAKNLDTNNLSVFLIEQITEKKITTLVFGRPFNFKLQHTKTTGNILQYTEELKELILEQKIKVNIDWINENGSTQANQNLIKPANKLSKEAKQDRKNQINHLAAMELGQRYFRQSL